VVGIRNSSRRYKHDIQPMDKASETLYRLKPVTFKYNSDWKGTKQYDLIAEDVEEVDPGLVTRDKEGKLYSVRYDQVNAMLLNEFLKAHRKIEQQGATIAQQQKQIEALTAGLQKVSAQLEVSHPAPQTVLNGQ
jgi:trimeric autotransporter adhesin